LRRILEASGDSSARHAASVLWIFSIALPLKRHGPDRP
jgi:hypothetical protein